MEADWEVEIGGDAPVIDAHWPGFVDLQSSPERICEIKETEELPALADLLRSLNSPHSPVWTSKCDVWRTEADGLACYVDLLPRNEGVFGKWDSTEAVCREWVSRLVSVAQVSGKPRGTRFIAMDQAESASETAITLVIRQAVTQGAQGYGITAYMSTGAQDSSRQALQTAMVAFSKAIHQSDSPQGTDRR